MRISDWSSDVCSSDLARTRPRRLGAAAADVSRSRDPGPPNLDPEPSRPRASPPGGARARTAAARRRAGDGQRQLHPRSQIGREHVRTPVTNAPLVCRILLEQNNIYSPTTFIYMY